MNARRTNLLALAFAASAGSACYGGADPAVPPKESTSAPPDRPAAADPRPQPSDAPPPMGPPPQSPPPSPPEDPLLAQRTMDYQQAHRSAALKLVGALPTLDEMSRVYDRASYEAQIDRLLADPRFARQMKAYFQNMMKMGGTISVHRTQAEIVTVDLDAAPTFAAELVVKDRPMTDLFTAASNTCPTLDPGGGRFVDRSCDVTAGGVPDAPTSGVLTDPGAMAHFYSNMAFRRVRWIQETFACSHFPAELSANPVTLGQGRYTSPWPFESIASAPIDFRDTASVICANCHTTINHIAPLLAYYDVAGQFKNTIQVHTPIPGLPAARLSDWLSPEGRGFAWRFGTPVDGIAGLGRAIAADPQVMRCQVARAWNWAMSKLDVVDDGAAVPDAAIDPLVTLFAGRGFRLKPVLKAIFTHDDFVKF